MMIRLLPEQIKEGWDIVRPLIVQTLPPTLRISADAMSNILSALMREEAQFWVYYREEDDGHPRAICVTTVMTDHVSGSKYLLIYSMYALEPLQNTDYLLGLDALRKYAGANECKDLLAYVENDRFVQALQKVGGQKVTNLVLL